MITNNCHYRRFVLKDVIMMMKGRRKGFTLVELIMAVSLLLVIIALSFNLLFFGNKTQAVASDEYQLQSAARLAGQSTNEIVRYSTALFTINQSGFRTNNLTDGWDYFGLSEDGKEVVKYIYNDATDSHDKVVIVPAQDGLTYRLVFWKQNKSNDSHLLSFSIEATKNGTTIKKINLDTELEALNSLQVIDRSTLSDPATAIAYRSDTRPNAVYGSITMVLDTSGSMDFDIYGNTTYNDNAKRIKILKDEAKTLVEEFAKEQNISICLVPFETTANNPGLYYNAANQKNDLLQNITNLDASGGTNTGDGLRRAYYNIVKFTNDNPTLTVKNYLIILVDGVTTYYSYYSNGGNRYFYRADGNISSSSNVGGYGNALDPDGTAYVDLIGNDYIQSYSNGIKPYVIGFSAQSADLGSISSIASAVGAAGSNVYQYSAARDLGAIFESIRQDIINDLWVVNGPAR